MDHHAVNDEALDTIFRNARTQNKWLDKPVSTALLMAIYDLMRMGPTSANCSPARFVFARLAEAKERLAAHCSPANAPKVRTAPATAIIGYDLDFAARLPKLFPHNPGRQELVHRSGGRTGDGVSQRHACRAPISSSRRARSAWIAARCPASTMTASTRNSSPAHASSRTSSAASAMAIRPACSRAARAWRSTKPARLSDRRRVKILAVDTALGACSVAMLDGENDARASLRRDGARPCRSAGADGRSGDAGSGAANSPMLDRLAVTTGPGTFTGQRVGLAFMRGLRVALDMPLIGVTTLVGDGATGAWRKRAATVGVATA